MRTIRLGRLELMHLVKVMKRVDCTLRRWVGIIGKFVVVSQRFARSSASKPAIRDNHVTNTRNVVNRIQDF